MATTTPAAAATELARPAGRVTFGGALRCELTKIRSVRSTYWTLLAMFVIVVGFGTLVSWGASREAHGPGFDSTQVSLAGLYIGQLIIGVLGVLVISSEYSTGMIRTSLMTNPHRGTMIAAKGLAFGLVAFVAGLITSFAAFFVGQVFFSAHQESASISNPTVLRAVIGGALFLTACGLLAFGLGLLLRHTAGGIATVVGLLFVLTVLVGFLPQSWQVHVDRWIPAFAGTQIWSVIPPPPHSNPPLFAPWTGFGVLCAYAAIAIAAGLILFRKRDA